MNECKNGFTYNPLNKKCIDIKKTPIFPIEIKKELIQYKNKFSNIKKFKKKIFPFVNRVSANIYNRINYYNNIKKYFKFKNFENKCLRFYKFNNNGKPIYRIGNSLILNNRIGSDSANGIVFLSSFRDKNLNLFKFASKIVVHEHKVNKELKILFKLSQLVLNNKCPHFPILYNILYCKNFNDFNNSSFIHSNTKHTQIISLFPKIIKKNKYSKFTLTLNELANGDLQTFMNNNINYPSAVYLNAFAQIFISLIFFYKYIKSYHNDAHWGNFLFHRIKSKGFFHYKIYNTNYFLKNLGFLWVIWDYEYSIPFNSSTATNINPYIDIYRIIHAFIPELYNGWVPDDNYKLSKDNANFFIDIKQKLKNFKNLNSLTIFILTTLINFNIIQTKKPKNIINKTPFIID